LSLKINWTFEKPEVLKKPGVLKNLEFSKPRVFKNLEFSKI